MIHTVNRQLLTKIHWDKEIKPGGDLQLSKKVLHSSKLINILMDYETAASFQVLQLDVGMHTYLDKEPIPLSIISNLVANAYSLGPAFGEESIVFMLQNTSDKERIFTAVLVLDYEYSVDYGQGKRKLQQRSGER